MFGKSLFWNLSLKKPYIISKVWSGLVTNFPVVSSTDGFSYCLWFSSLTALNIAWSEFALLMLSTFASNSLFLSSSSVFLFCV